MKAPNYWPFILIFCGWGVGWGWGMHQWTMDSPHKRASNAESIPMPRRHHANNIALKMFHRAFNWPLHFESIHKTNRPEHLQTLSYIDSLNGLPGRNYKVPAKITVDSYQISKDMKNKRNLGQKGRQINSNKYFIIRVIFYVESSAQQTLLSDDTLDAPNGQIKSWPGSTNTW